MDNKFSSNLIAFLVGITLIGTDLFTRMPSIDRIGETLIGGYLALSLYHAWKFASPRFADLTSVVVFWLFPVVFTFTVVFSIFIGLVVSIPKFLISFFKWLSKRKVSRPRLINDIRSPRTFTSNQRETNVIPINFKSQ